MTHCERTKPLLQTVGQVYKVLWRMGMVKRSLMRNSLWHRIELRHFLINADGESCVRDVLILTKDIEFCLLLFRKKPCHTRIFLRNEFKELGILIL